MTGIASPRPWGCPAAVEMVDPKFLNFSVPETHTHHVPMRCDFQALYQITMMQSPAILFSCIPLAGNMLFPRED